MSDSQPHLRIATVLAIALALGSLAYFGKGFTVAWNDGDSDFRIREREWMDFSAGVYPNLRFTPEGAKPATVHSVYPAYALPIFGLFFGAGDFDAARIVLQALSLGGLGVMMLLGWKALHRYGWQAGFLGMAMAAAMSGNCTVIALGQFSLVSAGMLAAQILAIQANRPWLAGLFWAIAMIKPQIAFPFALLFLIHRQWRGILSGSVILAMLSLFALKWTGWTFGEYLIHAVGSESLSFVSQNGTGLTGALPISPRVITVVGIAMIGVLGLWLLWARDGLPQDNLWPLAGLASALGWVLFYHRPYDNPMLLPLILAMAAFALRCQTLLPVLLAGLLGISLYLPAGMVARSEALSVLSFLAPVASACFLLFRKKSLPDKNQMA